MTNAKAKRNASPKPGSTQQEQIFNADGTLRGVYYCQPSTRRGAVVSVTLGRTRNSDPSKRLTRALIVEGRDFPALYADVVNSVAAWHGVTDNDLSRAMHGSMSKFLELSGLVLREVTYQQAEPK
jgi:hypothetical protein